MTSRPNELVRKINLVHFNVELAGKIEFMAPFIGLKIYPVR
jgi:hypothetical protein